MLEILTITNELTIIIGTKEVKNALKELVHVQATNNLSYLGGSVTAKLFTNVFLMVYRGGGGGFGRRGWWQWLGGKQQEGWAPAVLATWINKATQDHRDTSCDHHHFLAVWALDNWRGELPAVSKQER